VAKNVSTWRIFRTIQWNLLAAVALRLPPFTGRKANSAFKSVASRPSERIPMMSGVWHIGFGGSWAAEKSVAFVLGIRGYDAAHATADADLYALSHHCRNALHEMR